MIRAAVYARYSSERQNERSIADQVAVCVRHAAAKGWAVVATFSDAAISGAAMANRPGLLDALDGAERGEFDLLLAEDEDRIARNLEHLAHVASRLRYAGITLATLSTDSVEDMHVAFKGLLGAEYLKNLSQKTRRGMASNAEKGLATGSRLYGYRGAPGGATEIVEAEAAIVRRIFAAYVAGDSPRTIAADLNRDGVKGPRGGAWSHSSVCGSRARANGVLHTELYAGVKVWNRMDVRKDPRTGKRRPVMRPETEWKRTPVPDLAILDAWTWETARAKIAEAGAGRPEHVARRAPWLFSGLVKCGCCGSSFTVYTTGKLVCAGRRAKGESFCPNRRTPRRAEIEARILEGLRDRLLSPAAVAQAVRDYRAAAADRRRGLADRRDPVARRLAEVERSIERVIDAVERGDATPAMIQRMKDREAERLSLVAGLAEIDASAEADQAAAEIHPRAAEAFAQAIGALQARLADWSAGETRARRELIEATRALVVKVEVLPRTFERRGPIDLKLYGTLAPFIDDGVGEDQRARRLGALVAGGGIEPPTCGL